MPNSTLIHLPTNLPLSGYKTVARCVLRVLQDSNRTEDIITAEEITAQAQLAYLQSSGVMQSGDGPDLLRDRPSFVDLDMDALRALPPETLGGAFARFFDANGLDTKYFGVPTHYTSDPERAYLMMRVRQSHDLWHVLTGFSVAPHDEILVHTFSLAQTGMPSSLALLVLGSMKHMLLEARFGALTTGLLAAYRRGRDAEPLLPVYWERYFEEPLESVRARYRIRPWTDADHNATKPFRLVGPLLA